MQQSQPFFRSAGITAAATLIILESVTVLLVWLYYLVALLNLPADSTGRHIYEYLPLTFFLLASVPPLISAIGIRIGVGLFNLKEWARVAALIWGAVALVLCLSIIATRPFETFVFPEHVVTDIEYARQLLVISVLILFLPMGGWLLFFFRRESVKAQFHKSPAISAEPSNQPS
jgi:hypothetical protein